jgi:hypothetical protein
MHLLEMIPPYRDPSPSLDALDALSSSVDTLRCKDIPLKNSDASSTFLGMPTMSVNMDVRKWNWPGYLTFGKGNGSKRGSDISAISASENEKTVAGEGINHVEVEVNASALEDAISCDSLSISRLLTHSEGEGEEAQHETPNTINGGDLPVEPQDSPTSPLSAPNIEGFLPSPPSAPPLPEFSMTSLHLTPFHSPTSTTRVAIHYFIVSMFACFPTLLLNKHKRNQIMLALIKNEENVADDVEADDLEAAAKDVLSLFDEVDSRIYDAGQGR